MQIVEGMVHEGPQRLGDQSSAPVGNPDPIADLGFVRLQGDVSRIAAEQSDAADGAARFVQHDGIGLRGGEYLADHRAALRDVAVGRPVGSFADARIGGAGVEIGSVVLAPRTQRESFGREFHEVYI